MSRPVIAIVGGGFSGAAVAYHLAARAAAAGRRIVVYEPRERLGAGLAYDTQNPAHRINVPADKMSLIPGEEGHFVRWLAASGELKDDPDAILPDGRLFPRRALFGDYVAAHLQPLVARGLIEHSRSRVIGIAKASAGWRLADASGRQREAEIVVIATTHPPPSLPRELAPLSGDRRLVADATAPHCLDDLSLDARVLIVGAGLTMADIVATLHMRRHRGGILAISRHGLRSRGHGESPTEPIGDFCSPPERSALSLLRRVRRAVRAAAAEGNSWRSTLDAVRRQGRSIWAALPEAERRKLVVRLRAYWDVHRFRVAPMVERAIDELIDDRRLRIEAARLIAAAPGAGRIRIVYRLRRAQAIQSELFDRVVVTTGPAHGDILAHQPALAGLAAAGHVSLDPIGLGLWCDTRGRLLDRRGVATPGLFVAGPLARGAFGELMGLAEVSDFASSIADEIAESLEDAVFTKRRA